MDSFVYDKMIGTSDTERTGNTSTNAMGRRVPMLLKNIPKRDASPPLVLAFLQAINAITKRYL